MGTKAGVGFSEKAVSKEAGIEAAKAALAQAGGSASVVMLFSTSKHDPAQLRDGVRSVVGPNARLIGGYAVGIITKDALGYGGHQVGVAVISSDSIKVDLLIERNITNNEHDAGKALGRQIKAKERGSQNVLLMYDSVKKGTGGPALNLATPLIEGMGEGFQPFPSMAGVGLLGDMQFNPTFQWFDNQLEQQSAMAMVLSGKVALDTTIMHGCKPAGGYHKVTKAEGATVLEIDGRPALDVIGELLGPNSDKSWEEYPLFVTLGVNRGDKFGAFNEEHYANRLVMAVDKQRKGLIMFEPDLKPGSEVQLMRRSLDFDYIGKRADEMYKGLGNKKPFFAFYIDCAGRASAYCGTEREEASEVQKVIGSRMPLLGMYSGVEIAKVGQGPQALDWTGVLCVFSETT